MRRSHADLAPVFPHITPAFYRTQIASQAGEEEARLKPRDALFAVPLYLFHASFKPGNTEHYHAELLGASSAAVRHDTKSTL